MVAWWMQMAASAVDAAGDSVVPVSDGGARDELVGATRGAGDVGTTAAEVVLDEGSVLVLCETLVCAAGVAEPEPVD